jgi:hypothetical protein
MVMWRGWKSREWLKEYGYGAKVEDSRASRTPKMRWIDSVKASVEKNEY